MENELSAMDVDSVYLFSKNSQENSQEKKKRGAFGKRKVKTAEPTVVPITTRSLEDMWPFVIDYHHNHTHVTDASIGKQYSFLHSLSMKQNRSPRTDSSKYIVFFPNKAGLGNTLSAWSEALLLAMYSQRFFQCTLIFIISLLVYKWKIILQYYSVPFSDILLQSPGHFYKAR